MGLKKKSLSKFLPIKYSYHSDEFRKRLTEIGLEKSVTKIQPFFLSYEFPDEDEKELRSSVDSNVYEHVQEILHNSGLQGHCDEISCILKVGYVQKVLAEVNDYRIDQTNNELSYLFKLLKEKSLSEVVFRTNNTDYTLTVRSSTLVNAISETLKDSLLDDNIYLASIQSSRGGRPVTMVDLFKKRTLFNILLYFFSATNFIEIPIDEFIHKPVITNKLSRLCAELLLCSHIEDDESLKHPVEINMRNKISRLSDKYSLIKTYLDNDYTQEFFNEDDFIDRINEMTL